MANHILRINSAYFSQTIPIWNEDAIRTRADFLVKYILEIWPSPGNVINETTKQQGNKPKILIILDNKFEVNRWRDVIYQIAEYGVQQGMFASMASIASSYFTNDVSNLQQKSGWAKLSNNWYVFVHMDRIAIKRLCQRLLATLNISENQWKVIEEDIF